MVIWRAGNHTKPGSKPWLAAAAMEGRGMENLSKDMVDGAAASLRAKLSGPKADFVAVLRAYRDGHPGCQLKRLGIEGDITPVLFAVDTRCPTCKEADVILNES